MPKQSLTQRILDDIKSHQKALDGSTSMSWRTDYCSTGIIALRLNEKESKVMRMLTILEGQGKVEGDHYYGWEIAE